MTAPRSVAFRTDWEPDPEELRAVELYLVNAPEQGDWEWEDHCEGLAGGILQALHVLEAKQAGADPARPPRRELTEPERLRYIAQARRLGQHVERLRAENAEWEKLHDQAERLCARCGADMERLSRRVDL